MAFSYSQLSTYRRCPKQYEYAYVEKVPRAISAGESFGSSIHNTLKRWGELEMRHAQPDNPSEHHQLSLLEEPAGHVPAIRLDFLTLLDLWNTCFIAQGHASPQLMSDAHARGKDVLKHFYDWWASRPRNVIGIEKAFSVTLNTVEAGTPAAISGRLDRIEQAANGSPIVIDYKTSRPRPQEEIDSDLQLSLYALACEHIWHRAPDELILLFLNDTGITERKTQRTPAQLDEARTIVDHIVERIELNDFTPAPSPLKCSHCPYRAICPASAAR